MNNIEVFRRCDIMEVPLCSCTPLLSIRCTAFVKQYCSGIEYTRNLRWGTGAHGAHTIDRDPLHTNTESSMQFNGPNCQC